METQERTEGETLGMQAIQFVYELGDIKVSDADALAKWRKLTAMQKLKTLVAFCALRTKAVNLPAKGRPCKL